MIEKGSPDRLGSVAHADGTNFALYSSGAGKVELCLFDDGGGERRFTLPGQRDGVWHGFVPDCGPGQQYGYRVHGPYDPGSGQRFNPHKLLIDPYARRLAGEFRWAAAVFDYAPESDLGTPNTADSAEYVAKSVVDGIAVRADERRPALPWSETVIYEANVRGYTMRHPALSPGERGTFIGMRNGAILQYLKALGITAIELMPVHEFIDERFLRQRGLRNFWGYNSIGFFAPAGRYAQRDGIAEFREMVNAIHDAGIEVILDVAYNHTGEGDTLGPSLCFRGIDNLSYYRTDAENPGIYINDTGCGNTLNTPNPQVQRLILDSLCYWSTDMGVDGFRFDLATVNGRTGEGFDPDHPLFGKIAQRRELSGVKLIAEPWDPGHGGYQLGRFPDGWSEWNDRYRDGVRRFWRGDSNASEFAKRLHGSSDLFEPAGRPPRSSVNFVSSHDGYTLYDLVSYEKRHNEDNGENNEDGHKENFSRNYGVEGPSDDVSINLLRRRQRLNIMATLLVSQGTPMILAGDEFGNSQQGNNNAYAQDNEAGWLDWPALDSDADFLESVRRLIAIRRSTPLLRQESYVHDQGRIAWLLPGGEPADGHDDWENLRALTLHLRAPGRSENPAAVAVLINAADDRMEFHLPEIAGSGRWRQLFYSDTESEPANSSDVVSLMNRSISIYERVNN